jgi:DNA polymerase III epsilon subunit-like protein
MQTVKNHPNLKDRDYSIRWAGRIFATDKRVLFLDSETTGLYGAEMVEIAVADRDGTERMNTLLMPRNPEKVMEIGKGGKCAADFHGLTPEVLRENNASSFESVYPFLYELLEGCVLVIYNAEFDWDRIIVPQCKLLNLELPKVFTVTCAMLQYAKYVGEIKPGKSDYTYPKLPAAPGITAHRAMGDCLSTIALVRGMMEETV